MQEFTCEHCGASTPVSWYKCSRCGKPRSIKAEAPPHTEQSKPAIRRRYVLFGLIVWVAFNICACLAAHLDGNADAAQVWFTLTVFSAVGALLYVHVLYLRVERHWHKAGFTRCPSCKQMSFKKTGRYNSDSSTHEWGCQCGYSCWWKDVHIPSNIGP